MFTFSLVTSGENQEVLAELALYECVGIMNVKAWAGGGISIKLAVGTCRCCLQ